MLPKFFDKITDVIKTTVQRYIKNRMVGIQQKKHRVIQPERIHIF